MKKWIGMAAVGLSMVSLLAAPPAQARITRIEITRVEPAFAGRRFGEVGTYEHVVGRAYGEVDAAQPANAVIQDIGLAPKTREVASSTLPISIF
jgi:hypothetical protein